MVDETTVTVRVSNTKIVAAFGAMVVIFGGPPVANYFFPTVRYDPYTGTQGTILEERVELLEDEFEFIRRDEADCKERQDSSEMVLAKLRDKVHEFQAKKNAVDSSQDNLIDRCMRRTQ